MKKYNLGILASLLILAGCAHTMMRGTVAMKVTDTTAHVCLGQGDVKVGDHVAFFKNRCTGGKPQGVNCELIKLGEGKVLELLNDHYSVVQANQGVKMEEGTIVQKM